MSLILQGDCRGRMAEMEENSVDAIVCDPPYGLSKEPDITEVLTHWLAGDDYNATGGGFMGKTWDSFVPGPATWRECYRVLKPGGYLLAMASSRTSDLMGISIRLAGFITHPIIGWCFGSGFPKATNLSKMIDKAAGAEREVVGSSPYAARRPRDSIATFCLQDGRDHAPPHTNDITAPATDAARQWDGWYYGKQSLKPALEPICVAQKPPEGRMVDNVLRWGCGAVNIDASRIGTDDIKVNGWKCGGEQVYNNRQSEGFDGGTHKGRFPANLLLSHAPGCELVGEKRVKATRSDNVRTNSPESGDVFNPKTAGYKSITTISGRADSDGMETVADWDCVEGCAVKMISEQSGHLKSGGKSPDHQRINGYEGDKPKTVFGQYKQKAYNIPPDEGTAARFFLNIDPDPLFYCAKASRAERNRGLEGMPLCPPPGSGRSPPAPGRKSALGNPRQNGHPTVKPLKLMRYLVRLVTPPGGVVLDPFAGSGTTLIAAKEEGFDYIGIELEPEYIEIAEARLEAAEPPAPVMTLEAFP